MTAALPVASESGRNDGEWPLLPAGRGGIVGGMSEHPHPCPVDRAEYAVISTALDLDIVGLNRDLKAEEPSLARLIYAALDLQHAECPDVAGRG